MKNTWTELNQNIRSFYLDEYLIHIIPTSHKNYNNDKYYIVVKDDAHFKETGNSRMLTTYEINEIYKIKL